LPNGPLSITDGIDIEGPGAQIYGGAGGEIQVTTGGDSRIFYVDHANAAINGLLLAGGEAASGGAVYANGGDLTISSSASQLQ